MRMVLRQSSNVVILLLLAVPLIAFGAVNGPCEGLLTATKLSSHSPTPISELTLPIEKLEVGTEFFVHPSAFGSTQSTRLLQAKVTKTYTLREEPAGEFPGVELEVEELGTKRILSYRLEDLIYRTILHFDERVRIGQKMDQSLTLTNVATGEPVEFAQNKLPLAGRFQLMVDFNSAHVMIADKLYVVPLNQILRLPLAGKSDLQLRLAPWKRLKRNYVFGEQVRFRDESGQMRMGQFHGWENKGKMAVVQTNSAFLFRPAEEIFTRIEDIAYSPRVDELQSPIKFTAWAPPDPRQEPSTRAVLNAAAALTSEPEFRRLSWQERWQTLVRFTRSFLNYQSCAIDHTLGAFYKFSDYLETGSGVCREQSLLLLMIAAETGFRASLYHSPPPAGHRYGHVWIETRPPFFDTLVIEPGREWRSSVFSRSEIGLSFPLKDYYNSPNRKKLIEVSPAQAAERNGS